MSKITQRKRFDTDSKLYFKGNGVPEDSVFTESWKKESQVSRQDFTHLFYLSLPRKLFLYLNLALNIKFHLRKIS